MVLQVAINYSWNQILGNIILRMNNHVTTKRTVGQEIDQAQLR